MTQQEFVDLAVEKYHELQKLNEITEFYDYEKTFETIWTEFGRQSLEKNIGERPLNPQKKTLYGLGMEK